MIFNVIFYEALITWPKWNTLLLSHNCWYRNSFKFTLTGIDICWIEYYSCSASLCSFNFESFFFNYLSFHLFKNRKIVFLLKTRVPLKFSRSKCVQIKFYCFLYAIPLYRIFVNFNSSTPFLNFSWKSNYGHGNNSSMFQNIFQILQDNTLTLQGFGPYMAP